MFSREEIMKILPSPIRIEVCCYGDFPSDDVINLLNEIRERHNKNHDTKIENIRLRGYFFDEYEIAKSHIDYNEFKIYVGRKLIHEGREPSLTPKTEKVGDEFYMPILSLIEDHLNTWHDEIVMVQKANNAKLKDLEEDGYDELLYAYYHFNFNKKALVYLKKLAKRYPHSKYKDKLCRAYRLGLYGLKKPKRIFRNKKRKRINKNF
jgi:hypothetical protein